MTVIQLCILLALVMFFCGVLGLIIRRNLILIMISIELMLNAVNLVFVAGSKVYGTHDGQVMTFFVITVAACEAAVGLAMIIAIFRKYGTIKTGFLRVLRG